MLDFHFLLLSLQHLNNNRNALIIKKVVEVSNNTFIVPALRILYFTPESSTLRASDGV